MRNNIITICFLLLSTIVYAGVDCNGDADSLTTANDGDAYDFGSATDFSVSFWINTSTASRGDFTGRGNQLSDSDGKHWSIFMGATTAGRIEWFIDDGTNTVLSTDDGATINDSAWHHVAVTFDRDGNGVRYVDGSTYGSADAISSVGDIGSSTTVFSICKRGDFTSNFYDGKISELAIWDTLLTAAEVSLLSNAKVKRLPLQIQTSNLKGYFPLDDFSDGGVITGTWRDISSTTLTVTGTDADSDSTAIAEEVLTYQ